MAKRSATSDINHENWEKEEEPEEAGVFQKANDEVLQRRVIRTAKRRTGILAGSGGSKASPFSGFAGFGNVDNSSTISSPFSFLNQNKTPVENTKKVDQESESIKIDTGGKEIDKKSQNLEILKDLNLSCNSWITEHLEKNPYCILTPIFRDYEKHLAQLDLETESEKKENTFKLPQPSLNSTTNESAKSILFSKDCTETAASEQKEKTFDFKIDKEPPKIQFDVLGPKNSFPFGGLFPPPTETKINLNVGASTQKEGDEEEEEESNEPPKSDFTPVVEEDSIYDIRCKIFVKKDNKFISKGVGTLFLKPVKSSKNTQLIVRADTSSGNILLNILLTSNLPIQKMGENNVMIVCVPTPDCQPPPVPVLIRVKTSEDCDQVIKKLEECKGS
ncbi:UNVERIFIED_CONTAM: hypothetical protein PYX00_007872 [Menopon gallinae]|uniref:RanBD1 domain-containing protein n=1 Tax=Menopon gallinae TaxID=328185 RepID=A0AAW2HL27_9NEOP